MRTICVAKMLDNTQSIICAFCLAAGTPRPPYRHAELCGVALNLYGQPLRYKHKRLTSPQSRLRWLLRRKQCRLTMRPGALHREKGVMRMQSSRRLTAKRTMRGAILLVLLFLIAGGVLAMQWNKNCSGGLFSWSRSSRRRRSPSQHKVLSVLFA